MGGYRIRRLRCMMPESFRISLIRYFLVPAYGYAVYIESVLYAVPHISLRALLLLLLISADSAFSAFSFCRMFLYRVCSCASFFYISNRLPCSQIPSYPLLRAAGFSFFIITCFFIISISAQKTPSVDIHHILKVSYRTVISSWLRKYCRILFLLLLPEHILHFSVPCPSVLPDCFSA